MRALRLLLPSAVALLAIVLLATLWVLRTEAGASWVMARAIAATDGRLGIGALEGTLRGGLHMDNVTFRVAGSEIVVDDLSLRLNPDVMPLAVNLEDVTVDGARIRVAAAGGNAAGAAVQPVAVRDVLAALRMPVIINVTGLAMNDVAIAVPAVPDGVTIDWLALDASLFDALRIDRLSISALDATVDTSGSLGLVPPYSLGLTADARLPLGEAARQSHIELALSLAGDPSNLDLELDSPTHALQIDGSVTDSFDDPHLELVVESQRLAWPFDAKTPVLTASNLRAEIRGRVQEYTIEADARLATGVVEPADVSVTAAGHTGAIDISSLTAESPELALTARGRLAWADGFTAAANADIDRLDPSRWVADWPAGRTLAGRVTGSVDGSRIEIADLRLSQSDDRATLRATGIVDLEAGVVDGNLRWNDLQWPLAPAQAAIGSRSATLTVRGAPDNWHVDGDVALSAPDLPAGRFTLEGSGDRGGARVQINDSAVLGGRITGNVAIEWRERGEWSAELATRNLQLAPLLPDWPGYLSGRVVASGRQQPFQLQVQIPELTGNVRGRAIEASGALQVDDRAVHIDDLRVSAAASKLRANGSWQGPDGIEFSLDVESLSDVLPDTSGRMQASGRVRAGDPVPLLDIELSVDDASWRQLHVARLRVANSSGRDAPFDLTMQAGDVSGAGMRLDSVSVSLSGNPGEHRLAALASGPAGRLEVALHGGAKNWRDMSAASWDGLLTQLEATRGDELSAALRGNVPLSARADRVRLGRACIDNAGGGSLCAEGNWTVDRGVYAAVGLEALPLSLVRLASGTDLEFTQMLDGEVRLAADEAGRMYGSGRIDVSAGTIRNPFDERLMLRTREGFAEFSLATGRLLSGEIRLPFSDAAEIAGRFEVLDLAQGGDSPVEGHLTANVRNVGVATRLVPLIDDAAGRLNADIRVAGRLAAPELSGGLSLHDGLLAYDPLGLQLDDLQVDGEFRGNRIELESTFRAGAGRGRLTSSAWYDAGVSPGLELALSGANLTLVDLADLGVTVAPDLRVAVTGREVTINGRVEVPAARLSSVNLVDGGVSESPDVEFVGAGGEPVDKAGNGASGFDFDGAVDLVLGDEVVVDLDLAQARVKGSSTFSWRGPPVPRADGSFTVSGKFQAYGQLLEITEGVIRYPGIPATNPELRIRAEREIFGNSQVRRAGVLVSGTAARPQVNVYTTPATSEDRALTLLATGSDFNYEQGVGAVDVGTYIAPKLYASYGIGLFDNENVISIRYDLAKGFGIKATSGRSAAGVDLSYTIQN